MKARSPSDPTSWLFQANIHGTVDPTPAGNAAAAKTWRTCQHGSFFFLSWHRMYLYFFERILRTASNEPSLALPYWNYDVPAQRVLPTVFREPASTANPLFVAQRRQSINAGQPAPRSATGATRAMAARNFASATGSGISFGGQMLAAPSHDDSPHGLLESQPHDVMHTTVGGGNGLMTDPDTAARDPIFWLHHANIDRLWARWLALGQGRRNPVSGPWRTQAFNFVDEHGAVVKLTGADVVDQARQLGYRYDDEPTAPAVAGGEMETDPTVSPAPGRVLAATSATEAAAGLGMSDATFVLRPQTEGAVESAMAPGRGPVVLSIDGIGYRRPLGVYYEVYLNRRPGEPADPDGPYFAGNLAFFALGHARPEGVANARATLDVTSVLANQRERGLWSGGEVKVDLHPIDDEPAATESAGPLATIGQMRLLGE